MPQSRIDLTFGKIPPQAVEFETAVLGAIMLDKNGLDDVADILKPESFYLDAHQKIFRTITEMSAVHMPIDLITVVEQLRKSGELDEVGGPYYISKLTNDVVSAANIEVHARIIAQKFIQRELIRVSGEIMQEAYQDGADAFELLDYSEQKILEIGTVNVSSGTLSMTTVVDQAMEKIEEWRKSETTVTGITSGFQKIDRATRGWQPGDLIVLAARTSVGKTAFMLNLVKNAAVYLKEKGLNESVAVWSLEMKAYLLALRMLAAESKVILYRLQTGRLDDDTMKDLYNNAVKKLRQYRIYFDDSMGATIVSFRSKIRRMVKKYNLKLVFIDYLQLLGGDSSRKAGTREQEVSRISRELKTLAVELQIPIIALSQLSRDIEKRKDGRNEPQLSDIRESGAIEQDADTVMFLWGPGDGEVRDGIAAAETRYFKIAKQRNGVLVKETLNFENEIQLFSVMEEVAGGNLRPLTVSEQEDIAGMTDNDSEEEMPF